MSLRSAAVAALVLALILTVSLVLSVTGTLERLLLSPDLADSIWLSPVYNGVFGLLPTVLWFWVVLHLWMRSRTTPGSTLMLATLLTWMGDQVASNVWPRLLESRGTTALMWLASLLAILWPLLLGLGLMKSGFLPPLVSTLALVWGVTDASLVTLRAVIDAAIGSPQPIGFATFSSVLSAASYVTVVLLIVFLVALGLSVLAPQRLASISARPQGG